jgi:hypothetical protein
VQSMQVAPLAGGKPGSDGLKVRIGIFGAVASEAEGEDSSQDRGEDDAKP